MRWARREWVVEYIVCYFVWLACLYEYMMGVWKWTGRRDTQRDEDLEDDSYAMDLI